MTKTDEIDDLMMQGHKREMPPFDLVVILSGEEGSGKSHAVEYLKTCFEQEGAQVTVVGEGMITKEFYDKKTKTFDQFQKLPVTERRKRAAKGLGNRLQAENALVDEIRDPKKAQVLLMDRPWWDSTYYGVKRGITVDMAHGKAPELSFFDVLAKMFVQELFISYRPFGVQCIHVQLLPLSPEVLSDSKNLNKGHRPTSVLSKSMKERKDRLIWLLNYSLYTTFVQKVIHLVDPHPLIYVSELPTKLKYNKKFFNFLNEYVSVSGKKYTEGHLGAGFTFKEKLKDGDTITLGEGAADVNKFLILVGRESLRVLDERWDEIPAATRKVVLDYLSSCLMVSDITERERELSEAVFPMLLKTLEYIRKLKGEYESQLLQKFTQGGKYTVN